MKRGFVSYATCPQEHITSDLKKNWLLVSRVKWIFQIYPIFNIKTTLPQSLDTDCLGSECTLNVYTCQKNELILGLKRVLCNYLLCCKLPTTGSCRRTSYLQTGSHKLISILFLWLFDGGMWEREVKRGECPAIACIF